MSEAQDDGRVRLDKWLWAARFYKTRTLAAEAIAGGKVQVNGDRAKRARPLAVGDEVRIRQGPYEHRVGVRDLSERRGPASVAATLYEETAESRAARETLAIQLKTLHSAFVPDGGRPTKRDRRELERAYVRETMAALARPATVPRHANALQHMVGYFSERLSAAERAEMAALIADYRQGLLPLIVPLTLVRHHARRHDVAYLLQQSYLQPHPKELLLLNHA